MERRAAVISPREARQNFFAFVFQVSGWALVAPSCFVLIYENLCSICLTCIILCACTHRHVHALPHALAEVTSKCRAEVQTKA